MTVITDAAYSMLGDIAAIEEITFSCPWTRAQLEYQLGKDKTEGIFFAAQTDGEISGYVSANIVAGEVYINNIAVAEKYRRRGIGEMLLRELISRLDGNDFVTLEVRASNVSARRLYEKLGFVNMGERKNFYSRPAENACIYTLNLL